MDSLSLKYNYLILSLTPVGTPTATAADNQLCLEIFFSAPYSMTPPNVPPLKRYTVNTYSKIFI